MATRFRLPNSGTPHVSPATQTYTHGGTTRRPLVRSDGSTLTTVAVTPDASDHSVAGDAFHAQFVSNPLGVNVFAVNDAFEFAIQGLEAHTNNNLQIQIWIGVVSGDGNTALATLRSLVLEGTELATSLTNRYLFSVLDAGYTTVGGERLVVEFSVSGTPGGGGGVQGHNASLRWGNSGAGGDLPKNDTETGTTLNPWIEFANTIIFETPTIDELVDLYWHDPNLITKDQTMTIRHLCHMISGYMRDEDPGDAWAYNDFGYGLLANTFKKLLGFSGNTANIDSSTILQTAFSSLFGSVMQFEDGATFDQSGFRGNRTLAASMRDMARMGLMLMHRGRWGSTQIIPLNWFATVYGGFGTLFGHACVPTALPRTTGTEGSNYLNNPTGALTSVGGDSDQVAIGPGMYGYGAWINHRNAGGGKPWPGLPDDAIILDGHFGYEVCVIVPSLEIVVAAVGAWGASTNLASDSEWNIALSRIKNAVTGEPTYAPEFPGTTWNTATDAQAGLSTSELNSLESEIATEQGIFTRRGRVVRSWGTQDVLRDWASASKPLMILIALTEMVTIDRQSSPPHGGLPPVFYPDRRFIA